MPKYAEGTSCHVYIDLSFAERDRFKAACKANGLTMSDVIRYTIEVFCEAADAETRDNAAASEAGN